MNKLITSDDVYGLLSAPTASAALGAAIETGLLWLLAERPLDGAGVAQALGIPAKRCHYWLQLLCSLGILEESSQGYVPSSLAREAIVDVRSQESWRHLALDERERSAGVHDLALFIREPDSVWAAQGLTKPKDYVEKMRDDLDRAREFTISPSPPSPRSASTWRRQVFSSCPERMSYLISASSSRLKSELRSAP